MDRNSLDILIKAVVMLMSVIITTYIVPWIKSKVSASKLETITHYAEIGVRCAEQIFSENKDKKEYVINYLKVKADAIGLSLTSEDIENLLESTVNYIKYGTEYTR